MPSATLIRTGSSFRDYCVPASRISVFTGHGCQPHPLGETCGSGVVLRCAQNALDSMARASGQVVDQAQNAAEEFTGVGFGQGGGFAQQAQQFVSGKIDQMQQVFTGYPGFNSIGGVDPNALYDQAQQYGQQAMYAGGMPGGKNGGSTYQAAAAVEAGIHPHRWRSPRRYRPHDVCSVAKGQGILR